METESTRAISEVKQELAEDVLLPIEKGAGTMRCGTAIHRTDSNAR